MKLMFLNFELLKAIIAPLNHLPFSSIFSVTHSQVLKHSIEKRLFQKSLYYFLSIPSMNVRNCVAKIIMEINRFGCPHFQMYNNCFIYWNELNKP